MLIDVDTNSVIIDGINMAQYLLSAKFGYHKLWGSDSGRNMAMETKGSFKIFPKLTLRFRRLNQLEIETLIPIFNKQQQTTTYYDPELKKVNTIYTYTNDFEFDQKDLGKAEHFEMAFISRKAR